MGVLVVSNGVLVFASSDFASLGEVMLFAWFVWRLENVTCIHVQKSPIAPKKR